MHDWISAWQRLAAAGEDGVLVTVAGVRGSAPREVGAHMLVSARDASGTIGGGELEFQCTQIAAGLIDDETQGSGFLRRFPLGSNCGQCCGGVVDVLFERTRPGKRWFAPLVTAWRNREPVALLTTLDTHGQPQKTIVHQQQGGAAIEGTTRAREMLEQQRPAARIDTPGRQAAFLLIEPVREAALQIAVFGAGHVGSALVRALSAVDCELRWIDSRRDTFPAAMPANVQCVEALAPALEVAALPPGAYCLVMTHSHALDLEICAQALMRGDLAYCGLIGSLSKRRRFKQRLRQQGLSAAVLARLHCPIGVNGIVGKQPAEIAISVAADILRRRERQCATATPAHDNVRAIHDRR